MKRLHKKAGCGRPQAAKSIRRPIQAWMVWLFLLPTFAAASVFCIRF